MRVNNLRGFRKRNALIADSGGAAPRHGKVVGQHTDGRPIFRIKKPVDTKVPALDAHGKPVLIRFPNGDVRGPRMKLVRTYVEVDVVEEKIPDGSIMLNEHFRPDPEELARQQRARQVAETKDRLARALVDADMTPEDLIAKVQSLANAPEIDYPIMVRPGQWMLSDGTQVPGKKVDAEAAEAALHEGVEQEE